MRPLHIITILILLSFAVFAREKLHRLQNAKLHNPVPIPPYNQTELWFDQVLDHYDYSSTTTWKQRYYVVDTFFNNQTGPVFLLICGEYVCPGVMQARQNIILLAQKMEGLILVLEHRYYGKSMPFGDKSMETANLKLLNTEQALKDLAYFIMRIEQTHAHRVNKNPWITVGGSYPGAMSAWFRYKYPHLTVGAIASSAVVNAIEDFKMFDEQIYLSSERSGSYCSDAIKNVDAYVEQQVLGSDADNFKKQFGGEKLSAREFMFYWADVTVEEIQYGGREALCNSLKNKNLTEQYNTIKKLALTSDPSDYGSYYISNATYAVQNGAGARAWTWQVCTQFGWLQTYSNIHPMRSKMLDIEFYRKWCEDSYGPGIHPYIDRVNNEFGALNETSTNLNMVNGIEDPWIWAGLTKSQGKITAEVATCANCAHCVELYTPQTTDSSVLTQIRTKQTLEVKTWIEEYWRTHKQAVQKSLHVEL